MKNIKQENRLWTPARLASTIAVLSLVAAFGVSSCSSSDERRENPSGPTVSVNRSQPPANSAPAPQPASRPTVLMLPASVTDAELKAVSGAPIKLSKYAGKVLLVNLWATWCGPCRLEIPELIKFHNEYRAQGLEVVGLSTENQEESAEKVKRFVQDFNVNYRVGWATADVAITLMAGTDSIPQSFLIGRDGRVVKRFVGFNRQTTPPQLKEAIESALSEKAAD
ncbi:MAG TPA: redoxin family protein [Pyrinomonadaceae bacterium]|nr:redoxin family protein [Pyrinomonadaceae bacterium]